MAVVPWNAEDAAPDVSEALSYIRQFDNSMQATFRLLPLSLWPQQPPAGKYSYSVESRGLRLQVLLRSKLFMVEKNQAGETIRRSFSFGSGAADAFHAAMRAYYE